MEEQLATFIAIFVSVLVSFFMGCLAMGLFGGKTTLNYLLVKISKGKKILIWGDTPTGRRSYVGKLGGDIKEGVIMWSYLGGEKVTVVIKGYVGRYYGVNYVSLNVAYPEIPYTLAEDGEAPTTTVDNKTLNNVIKRALTLPSVDDDKQGQTLKLLLVLGVITVGAIALLYFRVITIEQAIAGLGVV